MTVKCGDGTLPGGAGNVFFYPAGMPHEELSDPTNPVHTVYMAFECEITEMRIPLSTHDADGRIREIALWLAKERKSILECSLELRKALVQSVICELVRLNSVSATNKMIDDVRRHIMEHMDKPTNVTRLAKFAGMSKFAFIRKYKALTGRTPMEEVRLIRMNHARDLILSTGFPLKEIAAMTGFRDIFQMTRTFRKCMGTTPGAFRRIAHHPAQTRIPHKRLRP